MIVSRDMSREKPCKRDEEIRGGEWGKSIRGKEAERDNNNRMARNHNRKNGQRKVSMT